MTTRQFARLLSERLTSIELELHVYLPSQMLPVLNFGPSFVGHNSAAVRVAYSRWCRGTVEGAMLVRIWKSYEAPELLMIAAATAFVAVSVLYFY